MPILTTSVNRCAARAGPALPAWTSATKAAHCARTARTSACSGIDAGRQRSARGCAQQRVQGRAALGVVDRLAREQRVDARREPAAPRASQTSALSACASTRWRLKSSSRPPASREQCRKRSRVAREQLAGPACPARRMRVAARASQPRFVTVGIRRRAVPVVVEIPLDETSRRPPRPASRAGSRRRARGPRRRPRCPARRRAAAAAGSSPPCARGTSRAPRCSASARPAGCCRCCRAGTARGSSPDRARRRPSADSASPRGRAHATTPSAMSST